MSFCLDITLDTGSCISQIDHFALFGSQYSGDLGAVTKAAQMVTGYVTHRLTIQ